MGRILKLVGFGPEGQRRGEMEIKSQQLTEDPFTTLTGYGETLRIPPYSLEQLVFLAEAHPVHAAALEQKASDIVAGGPIFIPASEVEEADQAQLRAVSKWWEGLFEDFTPIEVLQALQLDYETTGWGILEVARDAQGRVGRLFHIPAHTMRAHADGIRFAQIRQGRQVWFKRWGREGTFRATSGQRAGDDLPPEKRANEVLVFRKPSRRSTWYGIPVYISAVGWILLATTSRDYNILFFENAREPRHIFFLMGLDEDVEETLEDLEQQLRTQHKDPHRNLLLPLTGDAKVEMHRLALQQNDMHFTRLLERTDEEIFIAHRMPPDRVGVVKRGFLGGSVANVMNRIYKDSVVARGQDVLEDRLNRFLLKEYPKATGDADLQWRMDFEDLDIADEAADTDIVVAQVKNSILTLNEGRQRLGLPARSEFGDRTLAEYLAALGVAPGPEAVRQDGNRPLGQEILARLESLDELINDLMLAPPEEARSASR